MTDQETRIAACPALGCGAVVDLQESGVGQWWYECETCRYRSPRRDTKAAAIAAHNALATASARPKDVKSYEDMAREIGETIAGNDPRAEWTQRDIAAKLSELMQPRDVAGLEEAVEKVVNILAFARDSDRWDIINRMVRAVRPFCDPETLRQHGELLSICRYVNEWLRIDEPGNEAEDRAVAKVLVKAIIADCEATK